MIRKILVLIVLSVATGSAARNPKPDSLALTRLFGTTWELKTRMRPSGVFHRLKKVSSPPEQRISIYRDQFRIATGNDPIRICFPRIQNGNEFWMDCRVADQFIYRVITIKPNELVIDVLTGTGETGSFRRTSRNCYTKSPGQR